MENIENMNKISDYLDRTTKKTYSFYNGKGFKRKNHLKETCDKNNIKFYSLSDVITIHWVASDYNAMKSIHNMWKALVHDLREIEVDSKEFDSKTREKAKKRKLELTGKHFLIMFHLIFDIVSELSKISQNMQKRESLVTNIQSYKNNLENIFNYFSTQDGNFLKLFLNECQCESEIDSGTFESCTTVRNYLKSKRIKYEHIMLIDDKEQIPDVTLYRKALMDALIKQLASYFPDGNSNHFAIFDPRNFPHSDN